MIDKSPDYWQNKITAWLQESPVKVFDIANRDENAKEIKKAIEIFQSDTADTKMIQQAAYIASGLTRAALPFDSSKLNSVELRHPLVEGSCLEYPINNINVEDLVTAIKALLKRDLSGKKDAKEIFNYLFFAFNKQLRKENIGGLGAVWDIIPADTRMPDHPIWHHLGMTSAIYSSLERNKEKTKENLSFVVYSITPVQDFIGKARKLRDYWTGSVLLSYLAFCGIKTVMEELGPDHILYPSLQNQALIEQWLTKNIKGLEELLEENGSLSELNKSTLSIASFPNKFVFLCNKDDVAEICSLIENSIKDEWKNTAEIVRKFIAEKTDSADSKEFNIIWDNTIEGFWKLSWAATGFATISDKADLEKLLPVEKWKSELEAMTEFDKYFKDKNNIFPNYDASNLYGTTHSLVQGLLAAGKNKPVSSKLSQNGEKCPLCGEHEVLNNSGINVSANEYNKNIKEFWDKLRKTNTSNSFSQVGEHERLCAVCAVKRFLPLGYVFKDRKHILYKTLVESYKENFPSTTEMSAYEFLKDKELLNNNEIIQQLHNYEFETDDEKLKDILKDSKGYETKYYAFLLMDGDKMGDLVNGESVETSWDDIINIKDSKNTAFEDKIFALKPRTINPALHSMISDSLNNFARYGVQPAVTERDGKLIYAGGDDVCAIMPLSKALKAADKIRKAYQYSFAEITSGGAEAIDKINPESMPEKIVVHLGHSNKQDTTKISLSGAIIVAHHKTPLKEVINQAHAVLDGVAKEKSGRNSLAIRLDKRSGGARDMWFRWDEKNIFSSKDKTCMKSFMDVIKNAGEKISSSLLYKIENLKQSFEPLIENITDNKDLIIKLFEYEVAHSIFSSKELSEKARELAEDLAGLCIKVKTEKEQITVAETWFNPESVIIANFLAKGGIK